MTVEYRVGDVFDRLATLDLARERVGPMFLEVG